MNKLSVIVPLKEGIELSYPESIKKQKEKITLIKVYGNNPSKNRNIGLAKAKTEFIAFINAHTLLSDDWSEKILNFFKKNPKVDIVGGPQLTPPEDGKFPRVSGYALSSKFGSWKVSKRYSDSELNLNADETMLTSANLICRKKVFKKVKFDENIYPGEDPKFISDSKKKGFSVAYSNEIMVYNKRRGNIVNFSKQIFNYGKTRTQKEPFIETLEKPFFLIPSLFVIYLILLTTLVFFKLILGYPKLEILVIPLIIYLLINLFFSLYESTKHKEISAFLILPLVFIVLHLSYGIGILWGYLKK